jgi:two-component system chemotaxis response regulator CheB
MSRLASRAKRKSAERGPPPRPRGRRSRPGRIIVIGASAGGIPAIANLLAQLPHDLPAAVFVVVHLGSGSRANYVAEALGRHSALSCVVARDGQKIQRGCVYLAPVDHHMLVDERKIVVTKGPREPP